MRVNVSGLILEKVTKESKDETKHYLRLHQKGEKTNLDVNVSKPLFDKAKEMSEITLDNVSVGVYLFNGRAGLYAKQEF